MMVATVPIMAKMSTALIFKSMMVMKSNARCVMRPGCIKMNEAQLQLVRGLQDRMNIIIANYRKDPMYAPPEWTFENIWHALEALTRLEEA